MALNVIDLTIIISHPSLVFKSLFCLPNGAFNCLAHSLLSDKLNQENFVNFSYNLIGKPQYEIWLNFKLFSGWKFEPVARTSNFL